MRNGDAPSAVRVLPADGIHPIATQSPHGSAPRKPGWTFPLLVAAATLLVFVVATRPTGNDAAESVPTTAPPLLSSVVAETIDLTTRDAPLALTTEWEPINFQWPGHIAGTLLFNGSLVAYGGDASGPNAWLSASGAGWREVPRLETAGTATAIIDHAVVWDGGIVALGAVGEGVGLWRAGRMSQWEYQGLVPEMGVQRTIGLVAGPQLLVLQARDDEPRVAGWTSPDGVTWTAIDGIAGLDDVEVLALAATETWFFAAGMGQCEEPVCRPVVYRSQDGVAWTATDGIVPGSLSSDRGAIVDVTPTATGLLAVGWIEDDGIALWRSDSGATWTRIGEDETLFQLTHVTVQVHDIDLRDEPYAEIDIAGQRRRLAPNSEVYTDAGTMRVNHVGPNTVGLVWEDGSSVDAAPGNGGTQTMTGHATSVAGQGSRMVITGSVQVERDPVPAVWYSADGGETWGRTIADPWHKGGLTSGFIRGDHIVATGTGQIEDGSPLIWHSTWDTTAVEATGLEQVRAFVAALNTRDVNEVAAAVPTWRTGSTDPVVKLPSLGTATVHWWDEGGVLDHDAVIDTIDYLDALATTIELDTCTTRMNLGNTEDLRVSCGFLATSDFIDTMSSRDDIGRMDVTIADGAFQQINLSASPSQGLWELLVSGTVDASEADRATVVRQSPSGQVRFEPTFTAATAATHMRMAQEFTAGLLLPGATKVVDTAMGTMEWQWIDDLQLPVYTIDWVTAIADRFIAFGQGEPGRWSEAMTLFSSTDGLDWVEMEVPDVQSLWSFGPYQDGLVARAWRDDTTLLLTFDGDEWSEIEFLPEVAGNLSLMDLAVSGDTMMVLTGTWHDEGHGWESIDAWLIGPDLVPLRIQLPTDIDWEENTIGLVGSDEGFVLATTPYDTPRSMEVWHSPEGQSWTQIAATTAIEDATYVWDFQGHRNSYFVVGEGAETRCSSIGDGVSNCQQLVSLWSSPDGVAWDQVLTRSGEPLAAHEVGSGPLGLVAVAAEFYENRVPRPIYLSADGTEWDRAGNLALLHPDVNWWWARQPAIGEDTVVIPGSAYYESAGDEGDVPFLIVGRLVDR